MTNLSIIRSLVVLLAIFVTGLLAGVMLGVAMEQQTAQKLPEAAWTLRQQNDNALFRKVMPFTFITMMLLLIASIILLHGRSRMVMVAATVAALAVIIVTAGWEVPINNEIVKWNAMRQNKGHTKGSMSVSTSPIRGQVVSRPRDREPSIRAKS
jgi:hypothetical protein